MDREPDTFISLGEAAIQAVDACALAFGTDQRALPPDHADTRLWGPMAGANYDGCDIDGVDLSSDP